jgi:hypothetical protein
MQSGRTRIDGDSVRRAPVRRNPLFKFGNFRPGAKPSGPKAVHDLIDFRFFDQRLAEDQIRISLFGLS